MQERQLAAIMVTSIVTDTTNKQQELQLPVIEKYHGNLLKDSQELSIVQFPSSLDAVKCAREIQETVKKDSETKPQIGIHLGDITLEDDKFFGDGVKIATRIATLAEPGGIVITEAVYGTIKSVRDFHTQFLGDKQLANIDSSIRLYKLITDDIPSAPHKIPIKKYLIPVLLVLIVIFLVIWRFTGQDTTTQPRTILVLPFDLINMDTADQYLERLTTLELIRNLGKVKTLTVFDQETSFIFQASIDPLSEAIEKVSKTDYFTRGIIEKKGTDISINIELFDNAENIVWYNTYSDDLSKLSGLTGKIALDISKEIKIRIDKNNLRRIIEIEPLDPEIYELKLKAWNQLIKGPDFFEKARVYLEEAVDKDPTDARTHAYLAEGLIHMGHSVRPPEGVWSEAKSAAQRALQLDSLNADAWAALAYSKTYGERDYEGAVKAYEMANSLNPNLAWNHYHYAWHQYLYDQLDEAIIEHTLAQELEPLVPFHTSWLGFLYAQNGDYPQAMAEAERALRIRKDFPGAYNTMGEVYLKKGQYDSAIFYFKKANNKRSLGQAYFRIGDFEEGMKVIREIEGNPLTGFRAVALAVLYAEIDSLDRFFIYANFEPPAYSAPYLRKIIENPKVIQDLRFRQLMEKFDVPMPQGYE